MLLMAKASLNLWASPPYHNHRERSLKYQNRLTYFKPSSRTPRVSSYLGNSGTTIRVAAVLDETINQEITDYNVKINEFCKVGNLRKAMELLRKCRKPEIELKTYCSILQLCAEHKSLHDGREVHSIISSNGVGVDSVLGSKLVFMYVSCGDLGKGRWVFDKIANEKVFMWNFFINEYAKIGNFREGIYLYNLMLKMGVEVNSYTFSSVLKCFGAAGSVEEGENVHGYLLRLGFGSYNAVVNSLIAFYFKCGRVDSARKLFDELNDRDVISWNSMINGYVTKGLAEKGVEVFKEMVRLGVNVDFATMVGVVAACADVGSLSFGRALHAFAIKACFDREITFGNTLLDMYSKCGDLDYAIQVFENMSNKTVVSWTSMIAGYAREGLSGKAVGLFREMKRESIRPDIFTITSIIHACAVDGSLKNGKDVHNYIRENDLHSNFSVSNALIDMFAKCGSMEDANAVFSQMVKRDTVSWNAMIGGFAKNSLPNEALKMFIEMQHESKPDSKTIACVLPACASLAALERGRQIHGWILRNEIFSDQYVANALVDMYVKCGVLVLARLLFYMIPTKDLISWTVMIAGYGMHGLGNEAIAAFNEMRHSGVEPNEVSFISILYACSHSGLVEEGWRFFNIMRNDCNIKPKLEHYACMVDLLSRTGKLSEAYQFIKKMPIEADATVWGALLRGCRIHHDVKLAEKVAERVFELEPENTGYYILVANIYAEAEKWEEVKRMRARIGRHGLRANPCCSWIEVKGKVNIFVAGGGGSHLQANRIEVLLKKLSMKMRAQGYFIKTRYAFINSDDVEKEVSLCGHSEKLAMAFGILSLPQGKTIRVTKNLRICGDCHEMAKFTSKIMSREIVLRDSNRFHHFKDGCCSCRGYW